MEEIEMSLVINNNMMAANTARNLSATYGRLARSVERLSTGQRINSAADDAAGLAIREGMRAEIAALRQGIRNAQDGISMIQTAEGALAVIDEKLIRMKELAEQAATGTYTNEQRMIIHSEFAAMASEIDRIATATTFNGIKLLDGNTKLSGNNGNWSDTNTWKTDEGYWINSSGWQEDNGRVVNQDEIDDGILDGSIMGGIKIHFGTGNTRSEDYYYVRIADARTESLFREAWETRKIDDITLTGAELNNIEDETQLVISQEMEVGTDVEISAALGTGNVLSEGTTLTQGTEFTIREGESITIGGITYTYGFDADGTPAFLTANGLAEDIKEEIQDPDPSAEIGDLIEVDVLTFNHETGTISIGYNGNVLTEDFRVREGSSINLADGSVLASGTMIVLNENISFDEDKEFLVEDPRGIATTDLSLKNQSVAQLALEKLNTAIERKENIRANLGSLQNRLENTITNLSIQAENLQASESRISDIDIAWEMTEFVRNQVITQAAVAMLGQANSLPQFALSLLN